MVPDEPTLTIGVEEEYFVVDRETRNLVPDLPDPVRKALETPPVGMTSPEFIRSQIEIGTPVSKNVTELSEYLAVMRRFVSDVVSEHDMAIISASTHPFAMWGDQRFTDKERYRLLDQALQGVVRRLLICGMHVHVEVGDQDLRIDLMNQVSYFLPHILALSGSSPFWHGDNTGLKSYRPAVFRALPRTGIPDEGKYGSEYQRHGEEARESPCQLLRTARPADCHESTEGTEQKNQRHQAHHKGRAQPEYPRAHRFGALWLICGDFGVVGHCCLYVRAFTA